jgi:hypothetical protein
MNRLVIYVLSAGVFAAGCSNMSTGSPTQPSTIKLSIGGDVRQGFSAAKDGQQITVSPTELTFCGPGQGTVVATTNFAGTIIASATPGCLLTPGSAEATADPGNGHSATFTVQGISCTLTFVDRKGNTATATVSQSCS